MVNICISLIRPELSKRRDRVKTYKERITMFDLTKILMGPVQLNNTKKKLRILNSMDQIIVALLS